jgi:four helix bundle protein
MPFVPRRRSLENWGKDEVMKFTRFEDLPVWQLAITLYEQAHELAERGPQLGDVFRTEFQKAALQISNQIAETFEHGTKSEVLRHIELARGAAGSLRSMIFILQRQTHTPSREPQLADLREGVESCSRQLRAWLEVVRKSNLEDEPGRPLPSPERFQRLLENLPPSHSLRKSDL